MIFTICGGYNGVRRALFKRGWLEKPVCTYYSGPYSLSPSVDQLLTMIPRRPIGMDDNEYITNIENFVICQLLRRYDPDFYWNAQVPASYWRRYKNRKPYKNRFPFSYFTCKSGLCNTLYQMYWYYRPGVSETLLPRCYHSFYYEQMEAFIQDYRLTACMSLLKKCLSQLENLTPYDPHNDEKSLPFHIIQFAIDRCYDYIAFKTHEDIDKALPHVTISEWNEFFKFHQLFAHLRGKFINHLAKDINEWKEKINDVLSKIKPFWPQYNIDGMLNLWIVKPSNSCRGQGIRIVSDYNELTSSIRGRKNVVVQKYIECPLLIHQTKFDIRQWFLVTSVNPLVVWIYKASYLRFSGNKYDLRNLHESIHLTNHAVQRHYPISRDRDSSLPRENMWSFNIFKTYLLWQGHGDKWDDVIYPGMKQAIAGVMLASQLDMVHVDNCFQLYGADFILDEEFRPWLLEVNLCPDMSGSTSVTSQLCAECFEDIIKVVVDCNETTFGDTGLFDLVLRQEYEEIPEDIDLIVKGSKIPIHSTIALSKPSSRSNSHSPISSIRSTQSTTSSQKILSHSFKERIGDTFSEKSLLKKIPTSAETVKPLTYQYVSPDKSKQPEFIAEIENITKPKIKRKKESNLVNNLSLLRSNIEKILSNKNLTLNVSSSTRTSLLRKESKQLVENSNKALNRLILLSEECEKIKQNKGETILNHSRIPVLVSNIPRANVQKSNSPQFPKQVGKKLSNKNLIKMVKSITSQLSLALKKSSSVQTKYQKQKFNSVSVQTNQLDMNELVQNIRLKTGYSDNSFVRTNYRNDKSLPKSIYKMVSSEPLVKITKNLLCLPIPVYSLENSKNFEKKTQYEEILNPSVVYQLKKLNSIVNDSLTVDKSKINKTMYHDISMVNVCVKKGQSDNLYKTHFCKIQRNNCNNSIGKKQENYFMEGDKLTQSNNFVLPLWDSYTKISGDAEAVTNVTEYECETGSKISRKYAWLFTMVKNELCWVTHGIEWDSFICPFIKNEFIKALLTKTDNFHIYGKDIILKFEYPIMEVDSKHSYNINNVALKCPKNLLDLMSAVINRKYLNFVRDDYFHNLKMEINKRILIDEVLVQSKLIKYEERIRQAIQRQIGFLFENIKNYTNKNSVEPKCEKKFWEKTKNNIKNYDSNNDMFSVPPADDQRLNKISPASSDKSLENIDDDIQNLRVTLQNMVIPARTSPNFDRLSPKEEEYNWLRYVSKQNGLRRDINRLMETKAKNVNPVKKEIPKPKQLGKARVQKGQNPESEKTVMKIDFAKSMPEKISGSQSCSSCKLEVITENVTLKFEKKNSKSSMKDMNMKIGKSPNVSKSTTGCCIKSKSKTSMNNFSKSNNNFIKGNLLAKLTANDETIFSIFDPVDDSNKLVKDFLAYQQYLDHSTKISSNNIFIKDAIENTFDKSRPSSSNNQLRDYRSSSILFTPDSSTSSSSCRSQRKYTVRGVILPPKDPEYYRKFTLNYKKPKPSSPILVTASVIEARRKSFMELQLQKKKLDREVRLENKHFARRNRKKSVKKSKRKDKTENNKKRKHKKCKKRRVDQPVIKSMIKESKVIAKKLKLDESSDECGIIEEL